MTNLVLNTRKKTNRIAKTSKKRLQTKHEEKWNRNYKLAKAYYEYYRNLEVSQFFKTVNGYDYDENGIALGRWISNQRQAYKGQGYEKITEDQIELLNQIGMKWFSENIDMKLQKKK